MKTHTQEYLSQMGRSSIRLSMAIAAAASLWIGPLASVASSNESDISGGNVSDISGGNGSDNSGGNGSDISGGSGSDGSTDNGTIVLSNNIQSLVDQLSNGCGSGCSLDDLAQILEILNLSQDACASLSACSDAAQQRLENAANQVQQIIDNS